MDLEQETVFCFSSDIDWASDTVWKYLHQLYEEYNIPPIYFVTHRSSYFEEIKGVDEVKFGIHPNFMPGSSQGNTIGEVIRFCFSLVPDAKISRCHVHFDSNQISSHLYKEGIRFDSNITTRLEPKIRPLLMNSGILRFPVFFEDGNYSEYNSNWSFSSLLPFIETPGLKIFNLHPVNMVLNIPDRKHYDSIRQEFPNEKWQNMTPQDVQKHTYKGQGPWGLMKDVFNYINDNCKIVMPFNEICKYFSLEN